MSYVQFLFALILTAGSSFGLLGQESLEQVKAEGAAKSKYRTVLAKQEADKVIAADLDGFRKEIEPILNSTCLQCHGPDKDKGDFRIDTLDPDLVIGQDGDWWLEVMEVLSNGDMPPPDDEVEMTGVDRGRVINWLSEQILVASQAQLGNSKHSSFRRMTRYEFKYVLQDLLKLQQDFSTDLPPESASEDGFLNSSETLQMTSQQFGTYHDIARRALRTALVEGPRPKPVYFGMTMEKAGPDFVPWAEEYLDYYTERKKREVLDSDIKGRFVKAMGQVDDGKFSKKKTYFLNQDTGEYWNRYFPNGFSPWLANHKKPIIPKQPSFVMVLPHGEDQKFDLANVLPKRGVMRVRFRAWRESSESKGYPSVALSFGYNPNNNSSHEFELSKNDLAITATADHPEFYEWLIPLDGISRNPYLPTGTLGRRPSPNEYVNFRNVHAGNEEGEGTGVVIDYIEVTAPYIQQWPPASHLAVIPAETAGQTALEQALSVLTSFMPKAWRRSVSKRELESKLNLFEAVSPTCESFPEAMVEVLATVLSSPNFLYLTQSVETLTDAELAERLSFFLWSSQPDKTLREVVESGRLRRPGVLTQQMERLLADPRSERFIREFTRQWLGMELLDQWQVDGEVYPDFPKSLKKAMGQEPLAFMNHILKEDRSVMDFLHSDYTFVNQRLANHYGLKEVYGNHFRKVQFPETSKRGGILAQAGLLAMNSDGKDSHPLKRSIWLLENILNDPPPPAPPAVPEIDLTDPEIFKMTLKERMEDHRNDPSCSSCHTKIDPWGIALESFDAVGLWRDEVAGKPVDDLGVLPNSSELAGLTGLKHFLLVNRQDQFARAMVHKVTSYALGRPLGFEEYGEVEKLTENLRQEGDGMRTLIRLLIESDLFQNP